MRPPITAVVAALIVLPSLISYARQLAATLGKPTDFTAYFLASRALSLGLDPYHRETLESLEAAAGLSGPIGPYLYPPFFALAVSPIAWLDYDFARTLWLAASALALVVGLGLIGRETLTLLPVTYWPLVAAVLALFPALFDDLIKGQVTSMLLLLFAAALLADRRGWSVVAGALVGVAAAIKLSPLLFGLYWLARREWRAAVAAVGVLAGINVLTVLLIGFERHEAFLARARESAVSQYLLPENAALSGLFGRLLQPSVRTSPIIEAPWLAVGLTTIAVIIVLLSLLALTWFSARSGERRLPLEYGLVLVAMLLVSPYNHTYTLVLAIPAALALLGELRQGDFDWRLFDGLVVALILLAIPPVLMPAPLLISGDFAMVYPSDSPRLLQIALPAMNTLGLVLLFCLATRLRWRLLQEHRQSRLTGEDA
ncbi:MAG: DUF2029 domain-containing protein [Chloroflexi bacterium]|nr:DUF2029 domain-containing protein [Chloroflexota bacterium]